MLTPRSFFTFRDRNGIHMAISLMFPEIRATGASLHEAEANLQNQLNAYWPFIIKAHYSK